MVFSIQFDLVAAEQQYIMHNCNCRDYQLVTSYVFKHHHSNECKLRQCALDGMLLCKPKQCNHECRCNMEIRMYARASKYCHILLLKPIQCNHECRYNTEMRVRVYMSTNVSFEPRRVRLHEVVHRVNPKVDVELTQAMRPGLLLTPQRAPHGPPQSAHIRVQSVCDSYVALRVSNVLPSSPAHPFA